VIATTETRGEHVCELLALPSKDAARLSAAARAARSESRRRGMSICSWPRSSSRGLSRYSRSSSGGHDVRHPSLSVAWSSPSRASQPVYLRSCQACDDRAVSSLGGSVACAAYCSPSPSSLRSPFRRQCLPEFGSSRSLRQSVTVHTPPSPLASHRPRPVRPRSTTGAAVRGRRGSTRSVAPGSRGRGR
jgi:hypothetical protein